MVLFDLDNFDSFRRRKFFVCSNLIQIRRFGSLTDSTYLDNTKIKWFKTMLSLTKFNPVQEDCTIIYYKRFHYVRIHDGDQFDYIFFTLRKQ